MIYRKLTPDGDYTFGQGPGNFLSNSPATVGQAVKTRLTLFQGTFFINTNAGTPYYTQILGAGKRNTFDQAIKNIILGTQGVTQILNYSSSIVNRQAQVTCTVDTIYGAVQLIGTTTQSGNQLDINFILDQSQLG